MKPTILDRLLFPKRLFTSLRGQSAISATTRPDGTTDLHLWRVGEIIHYVQVASMTIVLGFIAVFSTTASFLASNGQSIFSPLSFGLGLVGCVLGWLLARYVRYPEAQHENVSGVNPALLKTLKDQPYAMKDSDVFEVLYGVFLEDEYRRTSAQGDAERASVSLARKAEYLGRFGQLASGLVDGNVGASETWA